jgi:hypothetical protein
MEAELAQKPNTFNWWREQSKRAANGEAPQTYTMQREMIG